MKTLIALASVFLLAGCLTLRPDATTITPDEALLILQTVPVQVSEEDRATYALACTLAAPRFEEEAEIKEWCEVFLNGR